MRDDYPEDRGRVLVWLICALVAGFILELVLLQFGAGALVANNLALSAVNLGHFKVWTLLSYAFLHDPGNLLHILFSVIGLYFLGRELAPLLGTRRFLSLFAFGAMLGGLLWLSLHWNDRSSLVGASAALSALFVVFACQNPDRPITVLILFIPVTLPRTRYLAYAVLAFELVGLVFFELLNGTHAVAHSAHLGGMAAGALFHLHYVGRLRFRFTAPWRRDKAEVIPPAWISKSRPNPSATPGYQVNLSNREHLKAEVDRILDKINSQGFAALTPAEKKTLDDARDMLSKH